MTRRIKRLRNDIRNDVIRKFAVSGPDDVLSIALDLAHDEKEVQRVCNRLRDQRIIVRCGTTGARPIFGLTDYGRTLWNAALDRLQDWSH